MISTNLLLQNAVFNKNMATLNMMNASDRLSSLTFNNSQPLKPSFSAAELHDEINIKTNETKLTVAKKQSEALEQKLAEDIKRSVPKFAGLDIKA